MDFRGVSLLKVRGGKTGDLRTGEVSEKHKKIVRSQVENAKSMMLQKRMSEGIISEK